MPPTPDTVSRCPWCLGDDLYVAYHDKEWGVPAYGQRRLFEFLILEGAQAGLSWLTILRKRENYRRAFDDFDPEKVANYNEADVARLLADVGIVRNRLKIRATLGNASAFLAVDKEFGGFDRYLWGFVGGQTIQNVWRTQAEVPVSSPAAAALSRDLRRRGFRFVGPTICYSLMQAVGLVNDHLVDCFRHAELAA